MSYAKPDWSADGDPYGVKPETSLPLAKLFWLAVLLVLLVAVAYLLLTIKPVKKTLLLMPVIQEPSSFVGPIPFRDADVNLVTSRNVFEVVEAGDTPAPRELCQQLISSLTPASPCGILYIKAFGGIREGEPVIWQSENEHRLSEMLDELPKLDSETKMIVVLDCCHDNVEFTKQMFGNSFASGFRTLLENAELPENVWFLLAADDFELSYPTTEFSSSEFSAAFASGCNGEADTAEPEGNADGIVTFNELFTFIRNQVTSQSPVFLNSRGEEITGVQLPSFAIVGGYESESQTDEAQDLDADENATPEDQAQARNRAVFSAPTIFGRSFSPTATAFASARLQTSAEDSSGNVEASGELEPAKDRQPDSKTTDQQMALQERNHDFAFWTELITYRTSGKILWRQGNEIFTGPVVTSSDNLRRFEQLLVQRDFRSRFGALVGDDSKRKLQDFSEGLSATRDTVGGNLRELEERQDDQINRLIEAWQISLSVGYDLQAMIRLNEWLLTADLGDTQSLKKLIKQSDRLRTLLEKTKDPTTLASSLTEVSTVAKTILDDYESVRDRGRKLLNKVSDKNPITMVEAYALLQSPFLTQAEKARLMSMVTPLNRRRPSAPKAQLFAELEPLLQNARKQREPFSVYDSLPSFQPSPRIALKTSGTPELASESNRLSLLFELSGSCQPGDKIQFGFDLDEAAGVHFDPFSVQDTDFTLIESRLGHLELVAEVPEIGTEILVPIGVSWNGSPPEIGYFRPGDVNSPKSLPLSVTASFQAVDASIMKAEVSLAVPSRNRIELAVEDLSDLPGTKIVENSLQKESLASIPQKLRMFSNRTTQYAFSIKNDTKEDQRIRVVVSAVARPSGSTWPRGYLFQNDPRIDDFALYSGIASQLKDGLRVPKKLRTDELSSCDIDLPADGKFYALPLKNLQQEGAKTEVTEGLVVEYMKLVNRGTEEQTQWEPEGTAWPSEWIELSEIHPRDLYSCTANWDANQRRVAVQIKSRSDDWEIPARKERQPGYRIRVSNDDDILEHSGDLSAKDAGYSFSDVSHSDRDRLVLIDIDGYPRAFTLKLPCRRDENANATEVIDKRGVSFFDAHIKDMDKRVKVIPQLSYMKSSPWSALYLGSIAEPPQLIKLPFETVAFHGRATRSVEVSLQIDLPRNASPRNRLGDRVHVSGVNGLRLAEDEFASGPAIDSAGLNRDRRVAAFWEGVDDEGGIQIQSVVRDYKLYVPRTGDNTTDVLTAEIREQNGDGSTVVASDSIAIAFDSARPVAAGPEVSKRRVFLNTPLTAQVFRYDSPLQSDRERIREVAWRVTETVSGNIREKVEQKKIAWPDSSINVELPTDTTGRFEVEVYWTDVVGNESQRVRDEYEVVKPEPKPKPNMKKNDDPPPPEMGVIRLNITFKGRAWDGTKLQVTAFGETKRVSGSSVSFGKKTLLDTPVTVQFSGTRKNTGVRGAWEVSPVKVDGKGSRTVDVAVPSKPKP